MYADLPATHPLKPRTKQDLERFFSVVISELTGHKAQVKLDSLMPTGVRQDVKVELSVRFKGPETFDD